MISFDESFNKTNNICVANDIGVNFNKNTKQIFNGSFLNVFYENMNGITKCGKAYDWLETTSTYDYDAIAICETWLDAFIKNSEYIDDKYDIYNKDRSSSNIDATKGDATKGVLIAIKNNIISEEYKTPDMDDLEAVCVRISTEKGYIYSYTLYIQPTASHDIYMSPVKAISNLNIGKMDFLMVLGDFNLSEVKWDENDMTLDYIPMIGDSQNRKAVNAENVTSNLSNNGLHQMCNIQNDWMNVLDFIYTNIPEMMVVTVPEYLLLPANKSDRAHRP